MTASPHRATWLGSDRLLARTVAQPIRRFLHIEASGGIVLFAAAILGLLWANSPWNASYHSLWDTELSLHLGRHVLEEDLRHWVNDGLMALFFFVIGLEIKNEFTTGELGQPAKAAVPIAGAIGGMVVPAGLYLLIAGAGDEASGWGIPMATDVAFALGVLALLGSRVPHQLKVLLLALAIVDDVGAIVVIALFYTADLQAGWLLGAVLGLLATVALRRAGVRYLPVYVAVAIAVWWMTLESGVHATIAGVALGLLTPARPLLGQPQADAIADELSADMDVTAAHHDQVIAQGPVGTGDVCDAEVDVRGEPPVQLDLPTADRLTGLPGPEVQEPEIDRLLQLVRPVPGEEDRRRVRLSDRSVHWSAQRPVRSDMDVDMDTDGLDRGPVVIPAEPRDQNPSGDHRHRNLDDAVPRAVRPTGNVRPGEAGERAGVTDLRSDTGHQHRPSGMGDRVDRVDLEGHDRTGRRRIQLRTGVRSEHDVLVDQAEVDRQDDREGPDGRPDPPEGDLTEQAEALVPPEHDQAVAVQRRHRARNRLDAHGSVSVARSIVMGPVRLSGKGHR